MSSQVLEGSQCLHRCWKAANVVFTGAGRQPMSSSQVLKAQNVLTGTEGTKCRLRLVLQFL